MGPTIILDKSSLQSLSYDELLELHKCYFVNISPVLVIEIMGDLKKGKSKERAQTLVTQLANKLHPTSSGVNSHYRPLLIRSLLGEHVPLGHRTCPSSAIPVSNPSGQVGIFIDESEEERALLRWKDGQYSDAEQLLAQRWRTTTQSIDLEDQKRILTEQIPETPKLDSPESLIEFADHFLESPEEQHQHLVNLLSTFAINQESSQQIFYRYETAGIHQLKEFAPFGFHCFRADLLFNLALVHGLIGTRATNRVDLEYLYYLPFCTAFSSGDKLHDVIAPLLMDSEQCYLSSSELKSDMIRMTEKRAEEEETSRTEETATETLWTEHMATDITEDTNYAGTMDKETQRKFVEVIQSQLNGLESTDRIKPGFTSDDAQFIIKKRTFRPADPCPCGSKKPFKDCCLDKLRKPGQ